MSQDIRRTLVRILAVSALIVSIVVGGTVLAFGLLAKGHAIATLARSEAALFISQLSAHFARGAADHEEVELALVNLLRERAHLPDGHFVAARAYSADGKVIAEEHAEGFSPPMLPELERKQLDVDQHRSGPPAQDEPSSCNHYQNRLFAGVPIGVDRNPTPNEIPFVTSNAYGTSAGGPTSEPFHI
ncbi:hypothetical protein [Defluviicoccus vanus]|uniref:Uncharacterized protein n=1 Tax=Defluviicoccus vanus TaxID=111831 RepID=A0A7H1N6X0_9PROT|nr:hypothetical protein [Defluviicoccus vanus]QNT71456.1 hypothetical protein HQ394_19145 [Defluviicoccus vanus]